MNFLTDEQKEDFRIAHAINNAFGLKGQPRADQLDAADLRNEDVVKTYETFANFVAAHGQPNDTIMFNGREFHVWDRVQMKKGKARGGLYLMEFDGVSATYFGGDV